MTSSNGSLKLEIHTDDKTPGKWRVPLGEDVFRRFLSGGGGSEKVVFSEGSIFSPFLFGKYFDPSDAFPLWEFEADVLLASLRSLGQCRVDWSQTDQAYVLQSDLPVVGKNNVQVYVDANGKVMEISGQWKTVANGDWRSGRWWEYGYVRRLELPGDADLKKSEAFISNKDDYSFLEIKIPKNKF
ncbi:21.7 kDa class VI heat shock protein [Raphanus sativus]|uniref:21.7 kDa class VI heat shock protein n=1 Tax=Raphanus sativus TaxID=3726 RepID=A0A6J0M6U1_RAPSA|nr:21.7 kDa class VI heat shock protein [Raphanus sativus]KAJ4911319.1 21.7 kDa class VI heat shock protein [Raphanus sativus]